LVSRFPRLQAIRSESGFSLPEILITIAIVGIAFVAILGGMITSITVSDFHRKEATADTLARDAAEWVKDTGQTYIPCAQTTGPSSYTLPPGASGYSVSVPNIAYWNGTSSNPLSFVSSCPSPDQGLQRITIVATSSDGRASQTVTIVKRVG